MTRYFRNVLSTGWLWGEAAVFATVVMVAVLVAAYLLVGSHMWISAYFIAFGLGVPLITWLLPKPDIYKMSGIVLPPDIINCSLIYETEREVTTVQTICDNISNLMTGHSHRGEMVTACRDLIKTFKDGPYALSNYAIRYRARIALMTLVDAVLSEADPSDDDVHAACTAINRIAYMVKTHTVMETSTSEITPESTPRITHNLSRKLNILTGNATGELV